MSNYISSANKTKLNKMNRAAQNVTLGTMLQYLGTVSTGSLAVTDAQANASRVVINTNLSEVNGYIATWYRSGSPIGNGLKLVSGSVAGTVVATSASGVGKIDLADVITYVAFK